MRDMRKFGGGVALVQAIFFLLVPVLFFLVLPRLGLTLADQGDPTKLLIFSTKNSALVLFDIAAVIGAATIVALALVLHEQLHAATPVAARGAVIAASIGAALLLAAAVGDAYDLVALGRLYSTNHTMATTAYAAVGTLALGLFWGGELAYGVWALVASWSALRSGVLAPAQSYLGMAWGILAILSVFAIVSPTLYMLALLAPVVGVVWAGWLGVSMLRVGAATRAPTRVGRASRQPPATPAT